MLTLTDNGDTIFGQTWNDYIVHNENSLKTARWKETFPEETNTTREVTGYEDLDMVSKNEKTVENKRAESENQQAIRCRNSGRGTVKEYSEESNVIYLN